jgi:hypothetical protein
MSRWPLVLTDSSVLYPSGDSLMSIQYGFPTILGLAGLAPNVVGQLYQGTTLAEDGGRSRPVEVEMGDD